MIEMMINTRNKVHQTISKIGHALTRGPALSLDSGVLSSAQEVPYFPTYILKRRRRRASSSPSRPAASMRGLPFPAEAAYNREQSLDFVSPGPPTAPPAAPIPNGVPTPLTDVVPLDPALGGPSSAPPYFPHVNGVNGVNGHGIQQVRFVLFLQLEACLATRE